MQISATVGAGQGQFREAGTQYEPLPGVAGTQLIMGHHCHQEIILVWNWSQKTESGLLPSYAGMGFVPTNN